ncbi:MAG: DNA adenine methylase [Candidatus Omnitrophica bacterium]|nr:DNA adenine methylase [Candidatus Omnitrophota bacterium]
MKIEKENKSANNKLITRNLSPLRYPGSKRKLALYIREILQHNKLVPDLLVEPFVGGASISLFFIINDLVKKVIISDKDKLISSFWKTIFSNPESIIRFIQRVRINLKNFDKYKNIAKNVEDYDETELAKTCIFLNRTSFSGVLTNPAGPIGGREQKSDYRIDCRFNRKTIVRKILRIASLRGRVIVRNGCWKETIKYAEDWHKDNNEYKKIFIYLDPPFYTKGESLYRSHFELKQHEELAKGLEKLSYSWILSYDNVPEIKKLYKKFKNMVHIDMPYSINSHAKRIEKELIITTLNLPNVDEMNLNREK